MDMSEDLAGALSGLKVNADGSYAFLNPGTNRNPLLASLKRAGQTVAVVVLDANAQGGSFAGTARTGDEIDVVRISLGTTMLTGTVPAPPAPQPVTRLTAPSVSGTMQVGSTLTATPGTYKDAVSVTHQWLRGTTLQQGVYSAQTVVGSALNYPLTDADAGMELSFAEFAKGADGTTLAAYVWSTTTVASVNPPTPTPGTQLYFPPGNPFNVPIPANPRIDPNSAGWVNTMSQSVNVNGSVVATNANAGWPIYYAKSTDPVVTVTASMNGQRATFHVPQGLSAATDSDGHVLIIEPGGAVETELYQTRVSGTWPNVSIGASGATQFNVSPTSGSLYNGLGDSGRGCGICCMAGLVLESEYMAGAIPHALACTSPWTAPQIRYPAIDTDGGHSGGVPMGTRWQLDPAYDISGLPSALRIISKTLQVYGCYLTDSTSPPVAFQGERASGQNAAFAALGNTNLVGLPWTHMRFLASWNGA